MKFPNTIRKRNAECKIYGKKKAYPFYRLAWHAGGKRHTKHSRTYSEAMAEANKLVKLLAEGSQAAALTARQATDALAALERLRSFYQSTGRKVSLLAAASELSEAAEKLGGRPLGKRSKGICGPWR